MKKKSQLMSFDVSLSVIIFIIIIVVLFSVFFLITRDDSSKEFDFELGYVFSNLENNLKYDAPNQFFKDYRIDSSRLSSFYAISDIDDYVVGAIGNAHGIGLDVEAFDTCLFLIDNDNRILQVNGMDTVGQLKTGSCDAVIAVGGNPCDDYKNSFSMFKPVLLDEGNVNDNRIIQMNLVLCKK